MTKRNFKLICLLISVLMVLSIMASTAWAVDRVDEICNDACCDEATRGCPNPSLHNQCAAGGHALDPRFNYVLSVYVDGPTSLYCIKMDIYLVEECLCACKIQCTLKFTEIIPHPNPTPGPDGWKWYCSSCGHMWR